MSFDSRFSLLRMDFAYSNIKAQNFCSLDAHMREQVRVWRNHPHVRMFLYHQDIIDTNEHARFIDSLLQSINRAYWVVFDDCTPLGVMSLTKINFFHSYAFLGIYASPDMHSKGAGNRILKMLEHVAFCELKLHSLRLEVFEQNTKAIAFYERNNYVHEGCLREFACINGHFVNILLMGKIHV